MKNRHAILFVVAFFFLSSDMQAKESKKMLSLQLPREAKMLDANQIAMWLINDGRFCRHPETGNAGFNYPKGSDKYAVYASGIWLTGKVAGEIRTARIDYASEFQAGKILSSGLPDNANLEKYRLYKIKPGDSANPNEAGYNKDYAEWPVADGAPVDEMGQPLILGDQTIWFVMNDANPAEHFNDTAPLGVEVQVLVWAYNLPSPLAKTVFIEYTVINKSENTITDAYIGHWADPDLGGANDDASACDTLLNLTYVYNGDDTDDSYGTAAPAVGFCMLQGPIVPSPGEVAFQFRRGQIDNAKNLNMTSNSVYY